MGNVCCPRKGIQELQHKLIIQNKKNTSVKQQQQPIPQSPTSPHRIKPKFESKSQPRKSSDIQMIQSFTGKFQRRYNVWPKFEQFSELVYCNYQAKKQIFMSFDFNRRSSSTNRQMTSYQYIQKKGKSSLSLIIREGKNFGRERKNFMNSTYTQSNIIIANLIEKDQDKINTNFPHGEEIFIQSISQLRLNGFTQIYLCLENENDIKKIKKICEQVTAHMTFQQRKRVVYMFSAEISLQQIAQIIFKSFKNFISAKAIQQIADNLLYDILLIDKQMVVVKRKCSKATLRTIIPLSIGLLMQQVTQKNAHLYGQLTNHLKTKNLKDYLKYKQSLDELRYHSQNDQKIYQKIKELNFLRAQNFQHFKRLSQKFQKIQLNRDYDPKKHTLFVLTKELKDKIGDFYEGYIDPKTQNTPVKKDWDQSLNVEDFYVPPRKYTDEVNYLEALRQNQANNQLQQQQIFEQSQQIQLQSQVKQSISQHKS